MISGKYIIIILFLSLMSCDCQYQISGIVLDMVTKKPISDVAIGKTDTTDLNNPFNRKVFTTDNGKFDISGIAGNCDEIIMYFSKNGYETQKVTFSNNSIDTILLKPTSKQQITIFNLNQDFEILEIVKSNDSPSSATDTTACNGWFLNDSEIKLIIKESEPISGHDWHYLFEHLPCRIHGTLVQDSNTFEYSINSGAWLTVNSTDTTMLYGSFNKENNKYFLGTAWTEELE